MGVVHPVRFSDFLTLKKWPSRLGYFISEEIATQHPLFLEKYTKYWKEPRGKRTQMERCFLRPTFPLKCLLKKPTTF